MNFKISGLPQDTFKNFFNQNESFLRKQGFRRCQVNVNPGYPCRVSLQDAEIGETVLLGPYRHHATEGPYQASGPVYVRESAIAGSPAPGEIPEFLLGRLLSLRAYNYQGLMRNAKVTAGERLAQSISELFGDPKVEYIHVHNAEPGCYMCNVERA